MDEQTLRELNQAFDAFEALRESFDETRRQLFHLINDDRGPESLFNGLDRTITHVKASLSSSVNRALICCGLDLADGKPTVAKTSLAKLERELQKAFRTSLGHFDGPAKFKGSLESTWSDFTKSIVAMPLDEIKRSYLAELRRADEFEDPTSKNSCIRKEFAGDGWDSNRQLVIGEFDCNRLSIKALSESEVCEKIAIEYEALRDVHHKLGISSDDNQTSRMIEIGWLPEYEPENCPFPKKHPPLPETLQASQAVKIVFAVRAVEIRKAFNYLTLEIDWERIRAEFGAAIRLIHKAINFQNTDDAGKDKGTRNNSTAKFTNKELCKKLDVSAETLSKYGKPAVDDWPGQGGGNNFRHSLDSARDIAQAVKAGYPAKTPKCDNFLSENPTQTRS